MYDDITEDQDIQLAFEAGEHKLAPKARDIECFACGDKETAKRIIITNALRGHDLCISCLERNVTKED